MTEAIDNQPQPASRFARRSRKDVYLRVRISKADRLAIYQAASDHLASVSGFVRGVLLDYIAKNLKAAGRERRETCTGGDGVVWMATVRVHFVRDVCTTGGRLRARRDSVPRRAAGARRRSRREGPIRAEQQGR